MYYCWQHCHFSSCWFYWIGLCDIYIWRSKILLWNKQKMGYCLDLPIIFNIFVKHNIATFIVKGFIFNLVPSSKWLSEITVHQLSTFCRKFGPKSFLNADNRIVFWKKKVVIWIFNNFGCMECQNLGSGLILLWMGDVMMTLDTSDF